MFPVPPRPVPPRAGSQASDDCRMKSDASEPAKLLDCACLVWRFCLDAHRVQSSGVQCSMFPQSWPARSHPAPGPSAMLPFAIFSTRPIRPMRPIPSDPAPPIHPCQKPTNALAYNHAIWKIQNRFQDPGTDVLPFPILPLNSIPTLYAKACY